LLKKACPLQADRLSGESVDVEAAVKLRAGAPVSDDHSAGEEGSCCVDFFLIKAPWG